MKKVGWADGGIVGWDRRVGVMALVLTIPLSPYPTIPPLQAQASVSQIQSGQELIYRGRFGAAQVYFSDLSQQFSRDPAGPALEASSLMWWGEARGDKTFQADVVDSLLHVATGRAQLLADSGSGDGARFNGFFWLGITNGFQARQADARGSVWRAARDARAMRQALERAVSMDSTCADCLLWLGIYEYTLARASSLERFAARLVGLGSADAARGLARLRRASEEGMIFRTDARWVYATALLREGERDASLREDGLRRVAELVTQLPENPVFRRALPASFGQP